MAKLKVAGYGRVSTQAQFTKGTSSEEQKNRVEAECKRLGYQLYHFYSDDGFSGKSIENRPGIQKLIDDAKRGNFGLVMFSDLDRVGRNVRDILNFFHLIIEDLKLDIYCVNEPIINSKGLGRDVLLPFLGIVAQLERKFIKERTERGRIGKWASKQTYIGLPPFGYRWDKETKSIKFVEEEKEICLKIYSMYLDQHYSMREIAEKLDLDGIPPPSVTAKKWKTNRAKRWNWGTIRKILKCTAYKGETLQNQNFFEIAISKNGTQYLHPAKKKKPPDKWILVKFPQMVSDERWDLIQARIQKQKVKPKRVFAGYEDHFLANNFLYCGECGSRMNKRNPNKNGGKLYYGCYWHNCSQQEINWNGKKKCILKNQDANKIDDSILKEILNFITNPGRFVDSWLKDNNFDKFQNRLKGLIIRKEELEKKISRGFEYIAQEDNSKIREVYLKNQEKDKEEYEQIQSKIRKIEMDVEFEKNKPNRVKQFKNASYMERIRRNFALFYKTKNEFFKFFKNLPFKEQKRILEAIISPENGGNCKVSYARPIDILDSEELRNFPTGKRHELYQPLIDHDPIIDIDFKADFNKIEEIITGLDKKDLLNKLSKDYLPTNLRRQRRVDKIETNIVCG